MRLRDDRKDFEINVYEQNKRVNVVRCSLDIYSCVWIKLKTIDQVTLTTAK